MGTLKNLFGESGMFVNELTALEITLTFAVNFTILYKY